VPTGSGDKALISREKNIKPQKESLKKYRSLYLSWYPDALTRPSSKSAPAEAVYKNNRQMQNAVSLGHLRKMLFRNTLISSFFWSNHIESICMKHIFILAISLVALTASAAQADSNLGCTTADMFDSNGQPIDDCTENPININM
jgi:hypothetical protein